MTTMLCDGAGLGYIVVVLLCMYGFLLFTWGLTVAKKQGWHVSLVYIYMMGMFATLGYTSLYAVISRYHSLTDPHMSVVFRHSIGWGTRMIPLILVLAAIVGHMTYRAFWLDFGNKE